MEEEESFPVERGTLRFLLIVIPPVSTIRGRFESRDTREPLTDRKD